MVWLSASRTGRSLLLRNIIFLFPVFISVRGWVKHQGPVRPEELGNNYINFIALVCPASYTDRAAAACQRS
jgi:hypothetical protein